MAKKTIIDEQIQKRKIEEWSTSGISQAEYCRGQRLSTKSFTCRKSRFRQKSAVSFVPVEVKPEAQMANISSGLVLYQSQRPGAVPLSALHLR